MLGRIDEELPPLAGVIHSVGVLADATLENQTWASFETVLWPKMLGAWHLHRATANRDLDLFVLFSSVAGILGNPGQANHASANAFLDQLAAHRRSLGLPGQAIAWGAWSELGEAEEQRERIAGRREATGAGWFTPERGFRALERLLRQDVTGAVVAAVDWPVFGDSVGGRPSLLEDLLSVAADEDGDASGSEDLLDQLGATPVAGREALLVSFLQGEVQAVLRLASPPDATVGFFDLGMDSLMAVELRNRLNRAFADTYTAPNTLVFDFPTIADLAHHLTGVLGEGVETTPDAATDPEPGLRLPVRTDEAGIAIVGMACRFPGAPDIGAFWRQLEEGRDAVTDGRQDGGSWTGIAGDPAADGGAYRQGGFVEQIDHFDARFFGMTPIGTRMADPQQRLLLETSWRALEDAGIDPEGLKGSRTGVYAGIATSEYRDVMMMAGDEGMNYLGTASSMVVGGVSFKLGLAGPAVPVLLNCAASLVTVQQAMAGLRKGEVDLALVGGVNTIFSPGLTREMGEFGMLSRQGRCKTFDAAADGFVRSEGCGMVVLKRLDEAEADGDRIWAVIRGAAVNQNGASAGPTVPNGPAQERVIGDALAEAGVDPSDVDYLEAHGAGSALGDPIEVQAAAAVYGQGRAEDRPLLIGSVKTNIGHLESAAGVAGLIKVVLSMRRGLIPKHLHFQNPNPHVDWDAMPVQVVSEKTDWPRQPDRPALAGVSAFGISGTNAHVVVEGYGNSGDSETAPGVRYGPEGLPSRVPLSLPDEVAEVPQEEQEPGSRPTRLLPLSAKSDRSLRDLAGRYLAWLDEHDGPQTSDGAATSALLSDMAWTAGIGRSHFGHRAAVVFEDVCSLRDGLGTLAASGGPKTRQTAQVAFAFADQDAQWVGMARALYRSEPVFRAVLERCDAVFREDRGQSLLDGMWTETGSPAGLDDPATARAAHYALASSLTALWASVGIRPDVVLGHGVGELAAAQAAGVLSLEDGLRLSALGVGTGEPLPAAGEAPPGDPDLEAALRDTTFASPTLAMVSGLTGRAMGPDEVLDRTYWLQAREPATQVLAVETLADRGVDVVVEIGSGASLGTANASAGHHVEGNVAAPLFLSVPDASDADTGGTDAVRGFASAVAKAYAAGLPVSFAGLFAGEERRRISLPDYPFERRRFWINASRR